MSFAAHWHNNGRSVASGTVTLTVTAGKRRAHGRVTARRLGDYGDSESERVRMGLPVRRSLDSGNLKSPA